MNASAHNLIPRRKRAAMHMTGATGDDCNSQSVFGGIAQVTEVVAKDTELGGYVEALNQAITTCMGMSAADKLAWAGVYAQWQLYHQQATDLANGTGQYRWYDAVGKMIEADNILCRFSKVSAQLSTFQAKATSMCGGNVPPAPPPPGGSSGGGSAPGGSGGKASGGSGESWLCSTFGIGCPPAGGSDSTSWASAIKYAAVATVVVVAAIYILPVGIALATSLIEHGKMVRGLLPAKEEA